MKDPYFVTSLARSGHHAIIEWICEQSDDTIMFHNNVNGSLEDRRAQKYGEGEPNRHLYSLENFDLRGFDPLFSEQPMEELILVIRDPFNWIASSLSWGGNLAKLDETWSSTAMDYEKWFCESMSRIDMYEQQLDYINGELDLIDRDCLVINYDKWFTNPYYREDLADKLDIPFTDEGLNSVPRYGEGSSFNGYEMDGKAQCMGVLSRWRSYIQDNKFHEYLSDSIIDKAGDIFGFSPIRMVPHNRRWDTLAHIIEHEGYDTMVEVGTADGKNIDKLLNSTDDCEFICVDPYEPYEGYLEENDKNAAPSEIEKNLSTAKEKVFISPCVTHIREFSTEAAEQFEDESLDLVFIDANHEYEYVKEDIETWWPKVRDGGTLAGHDYTWEKIATGNGIIDAVHEFMAETGERIFHDTQRTYWIHKAT